MCDIAAALTVLARNAPVARANDPEHQARIAAHAARVERECPRLDDRPRCYCCNAPSLSGARIDTFGWRIRPLPAKPNVNETYCPDCFRAWGWGDGKRQWPRVPANDGEPWTAGEVHRLRALRYVGYWCDEIAPALGRTARAVREKCTVLGLRRNRTARWLAAFRAGFSNPDVALVMGVAPLTAQTMRAKLRRMGYPIPSGRLAKGSVAA